MSTDEPELRFPLPAPTPFVPSPELARLRAECPVAAVRLPTGSRAWLVTRYDDNRLLLADRRFSRAAAARAEAPRARPIPLDATAITVMDPPEHTRLRAAVTRAFTQQRIGALRGFVTDAAESFVAAMLAAGPPADLVAAFARPLPLAVIGALLGVPAAGSDRFQAWSDAYLNLSGRDPAEVLDAVAALKGYLGDLVAQRRVWPEDDLLSALAANQAQGRLTDDEVVTFAVTLLVAGYETVAAHIANSVLVLLRHPDQLALLRSRPELLPDAVEELLRYTAISPAGGTIRVATEDVVLGEVTVRAGEAVLPAITSANRDPAVFADPDSFDVRRGRTPHLAFGHGIHHCLGASLARLELEVAFGTLLRLVPGLRLAVEEPTLSWDLGKIIRGPAHLPVTW